MKLFVGNLSYQVSDRELRDAFAAHVAVASAEVVRDRESGQSKGFGFVELVMASDAEVAVAELNGTDLNGRAMRVEVAKAKENRNREGRDNARPGARRWEG